MENGRLDNRELHILEEFKQGRLELFYRHVYPGLLLFAVRHAGEVHDFLAEDCVQDAVFSAWQRRENFDSLPALKSFCYTSIRNSIVSLDRKQRAKERYVSQLEDEVVFNNSVIDQETQLLLHNAIQALPVKEREIFEMCYVEGLKNMEVAERLGVSESTVKKVKAKALDFLKDRLDPALFLFFFSCKNI